MKQALLIFSTLIYISSYSQINFQEHIVIDNANFLDDPKTVISADVDGDGDMDVISASSTGAGKIGWFENLDGINISTHLNIISTEMEDIVQLFPADIDNDGDVDIFGVSQLNTENVFWFKNLNGLGAFSSVKIITNFAGKANSLYLKDIDGDLDLDLVIALKDTNKINWHENLDGIGNFGTQHTVIDDNCSDPRSVYVADIDNDGDNDILYSSWQDGVFWVENVDGHGNFNPVHTIATFNWNEFAIAKDIDGDGDLDIIASRQNRLLWYENVDGQGNFGGEYTIASYPGKIKYIQAADINNDGDLDIVVANENSAEWYENLDGQGLFGAENIIPHTNSTFNKVHSVFTVDIDNDGDIDVLSTCRDNMVRLFRNGDGLGNFDSEIRLNYNLGATSYVIAEDIDNDGDLDLMAGGGKVAWFKNEDGSSNFGVPRSIDPNAYGTNAMGFTDMDGDGFKDLIYSGTFWDEIVWRKNLNGQGEFGSKNVIFGGQGEIDYPSFFLADVDGDGLEDLITESESEEWNDTYLSWHKKLTDGSFGERQIIEEFIWQSYANYYADDLDNDGDMDILYVDRYYDKILWYKNTNGLGNFVLQQVITTDAIETSELFATDLDGDGDKDVLSASFGDNKIAWYENTDGNGLFGSQQIISTDAEGAYSVKAVDLDNDGDMDVISASFSDDKIAWYENLDGAGSFGDQQIITTNANGADFVNFADLDDDGDIDILSASAYDGTIAWYEHSPVLGINANNLLDFTIYPNPTSGKLTVQSNQTIKNIEVYTQLGQLILSAPNKNEIDISSLNSGIYFMKISDEKGNTIVKKVVKH